MISIALGRCPQLSMVGFRANQIRTVSEKGLPPLLRWLILTDNRIKATLNKPSKISAQTWMTQFFGLLCLSRGPFGQFAGR